MTNTLHSSLSGHDIHGPFSFVYADSSARLSATSFGTSDLYKLAIQTADHSVWLLIGVNPIAWAPIPSSLLPGGPAGGSLAGTYPNPTVVADSHNHTPGVTIPAYPIALPPSGAAQGDLTGNYPAPSLAPSGVTPGTYSLVTVDAKGRVTNGSTTAPSDIPNMDASKITSGTLSIGRIPLGTTSTTVCVGNDSRLSDSRTPTAHTHTKANITDFAHQHLIADLPVAASGVSDSALLVRSDDVRLSDNRTPRPHTHVKADITDFAHQHLIGDLPVAAPNESSVDKLVRSDDPRLSDARQPVLGSISFTSITGTVASSQITAVPTAALPTLTGATTTQAGTPGIVAGAPAGSPSRFLRADGTWVTLPGGGDMLAATYDANGDGIVDVAALANSVDWASITNKPTSFPASLPSISADLSLNNYHITNVGAPTLNGDATNKLYVDNLFYSSLAKSPVAAVATTNVTLSGLQTINSVSLSSGDRVLVTAQTDATTNGIYVASSGTWSRSQDFNSSSRAATGSLVPAPNGVYYYLSTVNPTLGSTPLTFSRLTPSYGAPLQLTSGVLSIQDSAVTPGTYSKVTVNSKGLVTAATNVTATDLPALPSLTGVLPVSKGGTGLTTIPEIRAALRSLLTVSASTTLDLTADIVAINSAGGPLTITLPDATLRPAYSVILKKVSTDTNTITVQPQSSQTIDGAPTYTFSAAWGLTELISDGTNYYKLR